MKLTPSQLTRLAATGGLRPVSRRPMAYCRLPESRWLIPVGVALLSIAALILMGLWGIQ